MRGVCGAGGALSGGGTTSRGSALCLGYGWKERPASGPTSAWYSDARLLMPGVFGYGATNAAMPPALYRAMVLNGAMTGATVYVFEPEDDLWFGAARHHWKSAIYPTLRELDRTRPHPAQGVRGGEGACRVPDWIGAGRRSIFPAQSARHRRGGGGRLHDMGRLRDGTAGPDRGTGAQFRPALLDSHPVVVRSPGFRFSGLRRWSNRGGMASPQAWTDLLDKHYAPDGAGTASMFRVGRGVFIMNNRESHRQVQDFRVPGVPAPVRGAGAADRRRD